MSELRIKIEGEDAFFGLIAARDVANLLLAVEIAVMRAASVVLGRPKRATGRAEAVIERAARFRLQGIETGSVVPVLQLPRPTDLSTGENVLDVDVGSLSELAISKLLDTAATGEGDPLIASALLDLTEKTHVGERYDALTFEFRSDRRPDRRTVRVDRKAKERLRQAVERESARVREDAVTGTLVEADFEKNTARLRGPLNEAVVVAFDGELADEIQDALRRTASFEGKVTYDRDSMAARSVKLARVTHGRQLILDIDPDAFWLERSFGELAAAHGAPATTPDEIYDADATEDERAAFLAALAELTE